MPPILHTLARQAARLLVVLLVGSAFWHGLQRAGWLKPWPLLDMDRTILWQKIELADRGGAADLVLLGDSSCLLDVDARALAAARGGGRVVNLGTVSHLSLASQGMLLERYLARASTPPAAVLVLLHPDALRREEAVPAVEATFNDMLQGRLRPTGSGLRSRVESWLGIDVLRQALQARVLPPPIQRGLGRRYGFTPVLREVLFENEGSLSATGHYAWAAGQGRAVYRLSEAVRRDSLRWGALLPAGVPLYLVVTPVPASFAPVDHAAVMEQIGLRWAESFGRTAHRLPLPAVAPDQLMADRLHLNEEGQRWYTASLAEALAGVP